MQYGGGLSPQVLTLLGLNQGYNYVSPSYGWAFNGNSMDGRARMQQMPQQMQNQPVSNPGNYVDWNAVNATTTRQMNEANARQQALAKNGSRGDVRQQSPPARQPTQFDAQTYEAQALNSVQFERNRQAMAEQQAKQRAEQHKQGFQQVEGGLQRAAQKYGWSPQQTHGQRQLVSQANRQQGADGLWMPDYSGMSPMQYGGGRGGGMMTENGIASHYAAQGQQYVPGYGAIGQISPQTQAFAQQVAGGNMNGYQKALAYANQFGEQTGPQSPNYFAARGW